MKKTIAVVVILVVIAGFLSAIEIKNSTFIGGVSYDYIFANGHTYGSPDDPTDYGNVPFTSKVAGFSVYGGYDVQIGNRWDSRLEYELLVKATAFNYKDNDVDDYLKFTRKGSKKRVGGYFFIPITDDLELNIGGVLTNITMGVSNFSLEDGLEYEFVQDLIGIGLILEGQYDLSKHFTLRFGIVPDFTFITIDRYKINFRDTEEYTYRTVSEGRTTLFDLGFSVSARLGISYHF